MRVLDANGRDNTNLLRGPGRGLDAGHFGELGFAAVRGGKQLRAERGARAEPHLNFAFLGLEGGHAIRREEGDIRHALQRGQQRGQ